MKRNRFFSLIELLVVVAVISILASLLMPSLRNAISTSEKLTCLTNMRSIFTGVSLYSSDYYSYYPGGHYDNSYSAYDNSMVSVYTRSTTNKHQAVNLGLLLYHDYFSHFDELHCPTENELIYAPLSKEIATTVERTQKGFKAAIDNTSSKATFQYTSYAYRGTAYRNSEQFIAHGPIPGTYSSTGKYYFEYLKKENNNPCTDNTCGKYHSRIALISDDFTVSTSNGWGEQINAHHKDGINVVFTDGSGELKEDYLGRISNLFQYYSTVYQLNGKAEDVWDYFDDFIGVQSPYATLNHFAP